MNRENAFYWARETAADILRQAEGLRLLAELSDDARQDPIFGEAFRREAETTRNVGFHVLTMPAVNMTIAVVGSPVGPPVPKGYVWQVSEAIGADLAVDTDGRAVTYSTHS